MYILRGKTTDTIFIHAEALDADAQVIVRLNGTVVPISDGLYELDSLIDYDGSEGTINELVVKVKRTGSLHETTVRTVKITKTV